MNRAHELDARLNRRALLGAFVFAVTVTAFVGAQRARGAEDGSPSSKSELAQLQEEHAASVHDRLSPLVFRVAHGAADARQRANDASVALRSSLEEPVEGERAAEVRVDGDEATVIVLGRVVTTITSADAAASGSTLEQYAAALETRLVVFVEEERQRSTLQALALRVFLTVLFFVVGFLTLRALRNAFARWGTSAEAGAPDAVVLFGVPVLSSDARKALTAVALMAARWASYAGVALLVLAASLGQFERTRPLLGRGTAALLEPVWHGVNALIGALPGLLLAVVLVVVLRAALEFLRLLLEGVAQGRVQSRLVRPERAAPARVLVTAGAILLVAPLVAAAAFGRFGAPLEQLALAAGICAFVAVVPAAAAGVVGLACLWRGSVKPGDWISIGEVSGEVSSVSLLDFVVVPERSGTVVVPMLALLFRPLVRSTAARHELMVTVKRDRGFQEIVAALTQVARSVDDGGGGAAFVAARGDVVECRLFTATGSGDVRDALVRALLAAVERGELALGEE